MQKRSILAAVMLLLAAFAVVAPAGARAGEIAYLTPSLDVPFWRYLLKGIEDEARKAGYSLTAYDSTNEPARQLANAKDAIDRKVAGILISPTDSASAPEVLKLAEDAGIPVVVADVGSESGNFVSFVTSDNLDGAYKVGAEAARLLKAKGVTNPKVAQITLTLARANGQMRAGGWRKAMEEIGATEVALKEMQAYSADESFRFSQEILEIEPDLDALFVHSDTPTVGAVRGLAAARGSHVMLFGFDGMPEFIDHIRDGKLLAAGMQQPYLMGVESGKAMFTHLAGNPVEKNVMVPIILVSKENIEEILPTISVTVFGGVL